jgi:hypothetical protein
MHDIDGLTKTVFPPSKEAFGVFEDAVATTTGFKSTFDTCHDR